jgi:hypothetical protein
MRTLAIVVIALVALAGCRSEDAAMLAKLDAPLRQKLADLEQGGRRETLSVLGKCRGDVDDSTKRAIAFRGGTVLTTVGDIFTARVPSERVRDLARLESVTQLQLSQMTQPTSP